VLEHERSCKIISHEAFAKLNEVKKFSCDGCERSYDAKYLPDKHKTEIHNWKPRACKKDGCDPNSVFQVRHEYTKHVEKCHPTWTPAKCQYPGCTSQVEFKSSKTYRDHLSTHGVRDRAEKDKYMPGPGKKPKFVRQQCRITGCPYKERFTQLSLLRAHLKSKHDFADADVEAYMSESQSLARQH
jgi:hypothetical protein